MWQAPKGAYYTVESKECYTDNYKIHIYKPNGVEAFYTIVAYYDIEGYCQCLEEFGFEGRDAYERS